MTLSHAYLNANLDILDRLGFPKAVALDALGIEEMSLKMSFLRIDIDTFLTCLDRAAKYTSDPNIALRLGYKFRVGNFGETGNLYAYCRDLKQVIHMNNLYQKVAIDAGTVNYRQDPDGGHHMCFSPYFADIKRYRPVLDMIMGAYVTTYRWLTWGTGDDIVSTHLPYSQPEDVKAHEDIFKSKLVFGSEYTSLQFSEAAISEPITTHAPERLARTKMKLDKILGGQRATAAFEEAFETAFRGALNSGQASSQVVAERMGITTSALRVKLKESGIGMRSRRDRLRKTLFIEKYEKGQSFSQIALALAYNDQASMNRAFHRWFGMTPSQWRDKHSAETD